MQIGIEIEIFLDAQVRVQAEFLWHIANAALYLLRVGGNVDPENLQLAGVGGHQSGGQAYERRFARSVGSYQRGQAPLRTSSETLSRAMTSSPLSR